LVAHCTARRGRTQIISRSAIYVIFVILWAGAPLGSSATICCCICSPTSAAPPNNQLIFSGCVYDKGQTQQPGRLRQRPVKAPELSVGLQNLHPATLEPCQHLHTMVAACGQLQEPQRSCVWRAQLVVSVLATTCNVTCSRIALELSAHDAQACAQASASGCALCECVCMMRWPAGQCARTRACTLTLAHTRTLWPSAQSSGLRHAVPFDAGEC